VPRPRGAPRSLPPAHGPGAPFLIATARCLECTPPQGPEASHLHHPHQLPGAHAGGLALPFCLHALLCTLRKGHGHSAWPSVCIKRPVRPAYWNLDLTSSCLKQTFAKTPDVPRSADGQAQAGRAAAQQVDGAGLHAGEPLGWSLLCSPPHAHSCARGAQSHNSLLHTNTLNCRHNHTHVHAHKQTHTNQHARIRTQHTRKRAPARPRQVRGRPVQAAGGGGRRRPHAAGAHRAAAQAGGDGCAPPPALVLIKGGAGSRTAAERRGSEATARLALRPASAVSPPAAAGCAPPVPPSVPQHKQAHAHTTTRASAGKQVAETLAVVDSETREAAAKREVVAGEEAAAAEKAAAAKAIKVGRVVIVGACLMRMLARPGPLRALTLSFGF
jgi:hypothetical protein